MNNTDPIMHTTYAVHTMQRKRFDGEVGWLYYDTFGNIQITDEVMQAYVFFNAETAHAWIRTHQIKRATVHQLDTRISKPIKRPALFNPSAYENLVQRPSVEIE